ncbi:DNA repair RAD52-like protein 2, chloroplastic [Dioscorea cayenensis subsp. rotundata]|uniref:DNA repair RAD52-like protein 2, chloroplastic n=1 Tax=Dioscorea cayennensis subsp. rotundata TaxID=55577 RepID=A0AB40AMA2_DIOCR|nr:DNA repair RAD52-like protein 2, chloroplastic [Dioscorea cayenensis subsp. rotundata]
MESVAFISRSSPLLPSRELRLFSGGAGSTIIGKRSRLGLVIAASSADKNGANGKKGVSGVPNTNYVVPFDKASTLTRPLAEILRDLNKRVPDKIINPDDNSIAWYHVNRMLSFYAPGWCGEIRDVIFSENGSVTVLYRVTIRGSDGEAHRESTGTVSSNDTRFNDHVAAAEQVAFCRACARFGFGLYLYHEDEVL